MATFFWDSMHVKYNGHGSPNTKWVPRKSVPGTWLVINRGFNKNNKVENYNVADPTEVRSYRPEVGATDNQNVFDRSFFSKTIFFIIAP